MDTASGQLLMIYHCTHRLTHLSPLIREASICRRSWSTHRPTTGQRAKNRRLQNDQPLVGHLYPSSQGSGIIVEERLGRVWEPDMVDEYREIVSSEYNTAASHMNSKRLWQHTQALCKGQATQNSNMERKDGHKVPPLDNELLPTDSCLGKGSRFSLVV